MQYGQLSQNIANVRPYEHSQLQGQPSQDLYAARATPAHYANHPAVAEFGYYYPAAGMPASVPSRPVQSSISGYPPAMIPYPGGPPLPFAAPNPSAATAYGFQSGYQYMMMPPPAVFNYGPMSGSRYLENVATMLREPAPLFQNPSAGLPLQLQGPLVGDPSVGLSQQLIGIGQKDFGRLPFPPGADPHYMSAAALHYLDDAQPLRSHGLGTSDIRHNMEVPRQPNTRHKTVVTGTGETAEAVNIHFCGLLIEM